MLILIFFILWYCWRYKKAKEKGILSEWKKAVFTRYRWIISVGMIVLSPIIGVSSLPERLKLEGFFTLILGVLINPLILRFIQERRKKLSIIIPVVWSVLAVLYIPIALEISIVDCLTYALAAVMLIFIAGVILDAVIIGMVFLLLMIVGWFSIPAVYVINR